MTRWLATAYVSPTLLIAAMLWGSAYLAWLAWRLWPRPPKLSEAARRVLARHGLQAREGP